MADSKDRETVPTAIVIDLPSRIVWQARIRDRRRQQQHKVSVSLRPSVDAITELLADVITLRDLYEKHRRQLPRVDAQILSQLYEKHRDEQNVFIEQLSVRVQLLGGTRLVMCADIAELTSIPRAPRQAEPARAQIFRLIEAHELITAEAQRVAAQALNAGDPRTSKLLLSDFLRTQELQSWLLAEQLTSFPTPPIRC